MSEVYKLDDKYIDSTGIVHENVVLNNLLNNMNDNINAANSHFKYNGFFDNNTTRQYTLSQFKHYLICVNAVSNSNISSAYEVYIVTTPANASKTGNITRLAGNNTNLLTLEFLDGVTLKITSKNWLQFSITEL